MGTRPKPIFTKEQRWLYDELANPDKWEMKWRCHSSCVITHKELAIDITVDEIKVILNTILLDKVFTARVKELVKYFGFGECNEIDFELNRVKRSYLGGRSERGGIKRSDLI